MQPGTGQSSVDWLQACMRAAQAQPLDRSAKADYLAGMSLLSGLVYAPETITAILSQEGIMDLIRESSFAQYLTQQAREEGIEQGGREFLLEVLALRFQPEDIHPLASRIEAIDDVQRLKQLHRAAIQVPNLEAFRHLLDADE